MKRLFLVAIIASTLPVSFVEPLRAYVWTGSRWPSAATTMYISVGSPWDSAFINAMALWNQSTAFRYTYFSQYADPCSNPTIAPARNGMKFSDSTCGDPFSTSTLAVTLPWARSDGTTVQAGVIFNTKWKWNVYNGPYATGTWTGIQDFQRVAVHELGHVIGLNHEDSVPAIMATAQAYGNTITAPQPDDIAGVNALYSSVPPVDSTGPAVVITSHSNGQTVTTTSITLSGAATDSGRGDNGISSVTVNGVRATADTTTGSGTAIWSRTLNLLVGSNTITVVARDNSTNQNATALTSTIVYVSPDNTPPQLTITSHTNSQTVSTSSITISGTANDSARGDSGISSVTVNGVRASGDIATGSGTANWNRTLTLSNGANTITVVAKDASANQNATTVTITINVNAPTQTSATASTYHVFPQFADGRLSDGSYYRTTVMIANPSSSSGTTCTLRLNGLTINGSSTLTYTLAASGWMISPTSATQSFQSGYATLQCSAKVEAQLLYSFYSPSGIKQSEATVFSSPPATWVQLLADGRDGSRVGLAIANDSDQATTYTLTAYNSSGSQVGTTNLTLSARSSRAAFLDELLSIPPNTYGQVYVSSSSGMASLIGLRFTGAAFTTIPGISRSVVGATASTYHVFPQFADGILSDGSYYRTTVMISNPSASTSASCTLRLYGLTVNGSNVFTVTLGPGGWTLSPIISNQSLRSGYATLQCSTSVEAQLLYSYYSPTATKISEATVFSSPSAGLTQLLVDGRESARLGLAIANDTDQSTTYTLAVGDAGGNLVGTTNVTLGPRSARAAFLDEFLPIPSGNYGQVLLSGNSGTASLIGLRFTGGNFTTIPETIR